MGPQLGNNLVNLGIEAAAREAVHGLGQDLETLLLARGGAGPRQWRPRTAGGLLPRFARHAPDAGPRLRHPLRVRHVRPADSRWLAGRGRRTSGCSRATVGDRARRASATTSTSVVAPSHGSTNRAATACVGSRPTRSRASPATRRCSATASTPATRCGCGRARRSSRSTSRPSTSAITTGPFRRRSSPRRSPRCSIPTTSREIGKRLRLAQQYFFVSCSLQDMLRLLDMKGEPIARFPGLFAVQLNDTHPSIAVAELMRLLVDERLLPWEEAWDITRRTLGLHQPHPAARGARDLGVAAVPGACCRGRSRSSTRSIVDSWRRCGSAIQATMRALRGCR